MKEQPCQVIELRPPIIKDIDCYHEVFSDDSTHHFIIDEGKQNLSGSTGED